MPDSVDAEETTIVATYSARRNADVARDYLADADIRSFVSTDDAGGMHPQLQRPHGVKLVGMRDTAQRARALLDEAGLLPPDNDLSAPAPDGGPAAEDWASTVYNGVLLLGALAVVLVLLMILLG